MQEANFIRSCLAFPDQEASALDPCAGEGRAMAAITAESKAATYGIELDSYRAEAAATVLRHVIQGDALSAQARVESFGLIYANPPFDDEFGLSGNRRFEVLFLSHFARWPVPAGILVYVVPVPQLTGCAQTLASHFRDVRVFRLGSSECARYWHVVRVRGSAISTGTGPDPRFRDFVRPRSGSNAMKTGDTEPWARPACMSRNASATSAAQPRA
jgi:predicted RNA methylase